MAKSSLSGVPQVFGADLLANSSTQEQSLGSYVETSDGRGYRYAKVGATSTVPGKVYASSAFDVTNFSPAGGLSVAAQAIGDTQVTVSTSTTVAANALAGGFLTVAITPGQGYLYRIKSNTATAGVVGLIIYLDDPILVALTTSSKVVVTKHPYDAVIVKPASASTGVPVGVATSIITNGQFGWLQTYGPCLVLTGVDTSLTTPGVPISPSAATAGAVLVSTAILPTIGWAMHLLTATEYNLVFLTIH